MAYNDDILALSPVLYYRLGETSGGTASDSSGNGYDGTYSSGPTLGVPSLLADTSNTAVHFDGSGQSVFLSSTSAVQLTGDMSISLLFKVQPTLSGTYPLISCGNSGEGATSGNVLYQLTVNSSNKLEYFHEYNPYSDEVITFDNFTVSSGTTYHIVLVRDDTAKTLKLYVDGSLKDTKSFTNSAYDGASSALWIGKSAASNTKFWGTIDEVAVFNSKLTGANASSLYVSATTAGGSGTSPYVHYTFNNTVDDAQGNFDGTITGSNISYPSGVLGSAVNAAVNDSYITASGLGTWFSGRTSFTTSFWVKPPSSVTGVAPTFTVSNTTHTGDTYRFMVQTYVNGGIWFYINSVTQFYTTTLPTDSYSHITVSYDGTANSGTAKVYINGSLVDTSTGVGASIGSTHADAMFGRIPANNTTSNTSLFNVDDFKIWETTLSDASVLSEYNTYSSSPTATAYWTLDADSIESGAFKADTDTADNRLTITGSVPTAAGYVGQGASFSGNTANGLVAVGTGGLNKVEELDVLSHTLSCWVKFSGTPSSTNTLISNCYRASGNGNTNNAGSRVFVKSDGKLAAAYNVLNNETYTDSNGNSNTTYTIQAISSSAVPADTWMHVTAVFSEFSAKLYINGVLDSSVTSSGSQRRNTSDTLTSFDIGVLDVGGSRFHPLNGTIDEVKVYDSSLNDDAVASLYSSYVSDDTIGYEDYINSLLPIARWKLDETSGTSAADSSGNGKNGTYVNSPTLGETSLVSSDPTGKSVLFDTSNEAVHVNNINVLGDLTISLFFNKDAVGNGDRYLLYYNDGGDAESVNFTYSIRVNNDGTIFSIHEYGAGTNVEITFSNFTVVANTTYHMVLTRDTTAKELKLYVDGELKDTKTYSNNPTGGTSSFLHLGEGFDGHIDDVALFGKTLTSTEVSNIYTKSGDTGDIDYAGQVLLLSPTAYWRLGETGGGTAYDEVGSFNGTYTNAPERGVAGLLAGDANTAMTTDGVNEHVNVPSLHTTLSSQSTGSVSFIANISSGGGAMFSTSNSSINSEWVYFGAFESGAYFQYRTGGFGLGTEYFSIRSDEDLVAGQTYHIVFVQDDTEGVLIYINGELAPTTVVNGTAGNRWFNNSNLQLDDVNINSLARSLGDNFYASTIDEVFITSDRLTATEVANLYAKATTSTVTDSYETVINNLNPVNWWKLDETSGTTATDSQGTDDLTYTNAPTLGQSSLILGNFTSKSVLFNGTDEYATASISGFRSGDSTGTIVAFIKTTNTSSNNVIFSSTASATATNVLQLYTSSAASGALRFYTHTGTDNYITGTKNVCDGNPHMVAAVSDGTSWKLYVDGVEDTISATVGTNNGDWFDSVSGGNTVEIGAYHNTSSGFMTGSIDDVIIFDRALSATELSNVYVSSSDTTGITYDSFVDSLGPTARYKLDEVSGTTAADSTGNGNTGTYNSATLGQDSLITSEPSGKSVLFDGTDDYISTPVDFQSLGIGTGDFSLVATIQSSSTSNGHIINWNEVGTTSAVDYVLLYREADGDLVFSVREGSGPTTATITSDSPLTSAIHNIVATRRSGTLYLYIDGVQQSTTPASTANLTTTSQVVHIGRNQYSGGGGYFEGLIDDVQIYDKALATSEIELLNEKASDSGNLDYLQYINSLNPEAWYKLDDNTIESGAYRATNDTADNRLTISGTVPSAIGLRSEGASFSNNNSNYLVAVGSGSLNKIEEIDQAVHTLSCWVKLDSLTGAYQMLVSNNRYNSGQGNADSSGSSIGLDSSGKFIADYIIGTNESWTDSNNNSASSYIVAATSSFVAQTNTWYHVVGTFTSTSAKLYINGQLDSSVSTTDTQIRNTSLTGSKFAIGAYIWNGTWYSPLDGTVDEVTVYSRELTGSEISGLYSKALDTTGLTYDEIINTLAPIAHWKLDEATATTTGDASVYDADTFNSTTTFDSSVWSESLTNATSVHSNSGAKASARITATSTSTATGVWEANFDLTGDFTITFDTAVSPRINGTGNARSFINLQGDSGFINFGTGRDQFSDYWYYNSTVGGFGTTNINTAAISVRIIKSGNTITAEGNDGAGWRTFINETQTNQQYTPKFRLSYQTPAIGNQAIMDLDNISFIGTSVETSSAVESVAGRDGTYTNSPSLGQVSLIPSDTTGKSVSFNATGSQYVEVSDDDIFSVSNSGKLGVSFWLKTGSDVTTRQGIISKGENGNWEWVVTIEGGKLWAGTSDSSGVSIRKEEVSIASNTTYYIAINFTGTSHTDEVEIYVDGVKSNTLDISVSGTYSNTTSKLYIGQGYGNSSDNYLTATVDDVMLFSDNLTSDEITALTTAGNNSSGLDSNQTVLALGPLAYWKLDEPASPVDASDMSSTFATMPSTDYWVETGDTYPFWNRSITVDNGQLVFDWDVDTQAGSYVSAAVEDQYLQGMYSFAGDFSIVIDIASLTHVGVTAGSGSTNISIMLWTQDNDFDDTSITFTRLAGGSTLSQSHSHPDAGSGSGALTNLDGRLRLTRTSGTLVGEYEDGIGNGYTQMFSTSDSRTYIPLIRHRITPSGTSTTNAAQAKIDNLTMTGTGNPCTIVDSVGTKNMRVINSPSFAQDSLVDSESTGKSVSFNGTTQATRSLPDLTFSITETGKLSTSFWVETGTDVTSKQPLVGKTDFSDSEWLVYIQGGELFAEMYNSSSVLVRSEKSTIPIQASTKYQVVVNFTGTSGSSEIEIYVNTIKSNTSVTVTANTNELSDWIYVYLAASNDGDGSAAYLTGKLDDVAIYSDNLTQSEIDGLYSASLSFLPDPIHHWTLDSDSLSGGSYLDAIGDNDLAVTGTVTSASGIVGGKQGVTVATLGDVLTGNTSTTTLSSITMSAWVNWSGSTLTHRIVDNGFTLVGDGNNGNTGCAIQIDNQIPNVVFNVTNNELTFDSNGNTNTGNYTIKAASSKAIYQHLWNHIAATIEVSNGTTTAKLYVNGRLMSTVTSLQEMGIVGTNPLTVGRGSTQTGTPLGTDGVVDDVKIWNTVLTESQIYDVYDPDRFDPSISITNLNPLRYWKLDETSGTTAADAGSSATSGTIIGGPSLGTGDMEVITGRYMEFDGVNDQVDLTGTFPKNGPRTYVFWAMADEDNTDNNYVFSDRDASVSHISIAIDHDNQGTPSAPAGGYSIGTFPPAGGDNMGAGGIAEAGFGRPNCFCLVQDGTESRMYINGVLRRDISEEVYTGNDITFARIGARAFDGTNHYKGKIGHVAIWDSALTPTQVATLVEPQSAAPTTVGEAIEALNPDAYWKLNDTVATPVVDYSGNGYDGYFVGTESAERAQDDMLGDGVLGVKPSSGASTPTGYMENTAVFALGSADTGNYTLITWAKGFGDTDMDVFSWATAQIASTKQYRGTVKVNTSGEVVWNRLYQTGTDIVNDTGYQSAQTSGLGLVPDVPYLFALREDASNTEILVNGSVVLSLPRVGTGVNDTTYAPREELRIGNETIYSGSSTASSYVHGALWASNLTDEQILTIYDQFSELDKSATIASDQLGQSGTGSANKTGSLNVTGTLIGYQEDRLLSGGEFISQSASIAATYTSPDNYIVSNQIPQGIRMEGVSTGDPLTVRYSTHGITTNSNSTPADTPIAPRLLNAGNYKNEIDISDVGVVTPSFGQVLLDNSDGALDGLVDKAFDGGSYKLYYGPKNGTFPDDFTKVVDTVMGKPTFDHTTVKVQLKDKMDFLDLPIIDQSFTGTGNANGTSIVKGEPKQRVIGRVWGAPVQLMDAEKLVYWVASDEMASDNVTNNNNSYTANDYRSTPNNWNDTYATYAYGRVFDGGTQITNGQDYASEADLFAIQPSAGTVRWYRPAGFGGPIMFRLGSSPAADIRVDVETTTSGSNNWTINDLIGERPEFDISSSSTNVSLERGFFVNDNTFTYKDAVKEFMKRDFYFARFDRNGEFKVTQVETPDPAATPAYEFNETNMASLTLEQRVPAWKLYINSGEAVGGQVNTGVDDARKDEFTETPYHTISEYEEPATRSRHKLSEIINVETKSWWNDDDISTHSDLAKVFLMEDRVKLTVTVDRGHMNETTLLLDVGDVVNVKMPRYNHDLGKNYVIHGVRHDYQQGRLTFTLWA